MSPISLQMLVVEFIGAIITLTSPLNGIYSVSFFHVTLIADVMMNIITVKANRKRNT